MRDVAEGEGRVGSEPGRHLLKGDATGGGPHEGWRRAVREAVAVASGVDAVGVGNELRCDDGVGLRIASLLRARLAKDPRPGLRVHPPQTMPERLLYRLAGGAGRIVIFDAVEAGARPGEVVCASLKETKYGFFATHNVPLRLVPGLAAREDDVYVVGVQPKSLEVGEGLSAEVLAAAESVVEVVLDAGRARP